MQHLDVHLLAIGGADERTYARHCYFGAMKTQIAHGIFDFVGRRYIPPNCCCCLMHSFRSRTTPQRARWVDGCLPPRRKPVALRWTTAVRGRCVRR